MENFPYLSALTFLPMLGALVIFFIPHITQQAARSIALVTALGSLVISVVVLARFDQHVQVGHADVHDARLEGHPVPRRDDGKCRDAREDLWEMARSVRSQVDDDAHRGVQVRGKSGYGGRDGFDAAGGRADEDEMMARHRSESAQMRRRRVRRSACHSARDG